MQFALLIYHLPEELAMRKSDYSDPHGLACTMSRLRHHDRYADRYLADADRPYWTANAPPAR